MRSDTIWPRILSSFMNVRHFVRLYGLHHASGQPRSFSIHLSHWVHDSQNWPVTSKYLNQWSVDFFSCPLQLHVYTQCFPVLNSCGVFLPWYSEKILHPKWLHLPNHLSIAHYITLTLGSFWLLQTIFPWMNQYYLHLRQKKRWLSPEHPHSLQKSLITFPISPAPESWK